jgi:hypothetical protein
VACTEKENWGSLLKLQQMRMGWSANVNREIRRTKEELLTSLDWISWSFSRKRGNWNKRSGSALITDFTGGDPFLARLYLNRRIPKVTKTKVLA